MPVAVPRAHLWRITARMRERSRERRGWISFLFFLGGLAGLVALAFQPPELADWGAFNRADYSGLFCLTTAVASLVVACG